MKKTIKPWLSGTLMVSMVLGSAQLQASAAGVGAFKDLNSSHNWGLKAIAKMAATGVIVGEPNGSFLPDNSVTQEQAITMVVNELGLKAEVQAYNTKDYNLTYKSVSDWAKPYVAIADKHNLLLAGEAKRFSGTQPASRQWVAQLLVRMIGKEDEAAKYMDSTTTFVDKNNISDWASSYVNLAASSDYGLINGSQNKDGSYSFNPTTPIKRIELAVLLDKAEKYLSALPASETQGQVTSIQGTTLTVKTTTGEQKYFVDTNTWVFQNGQQASISDLHPYQPVLLVGSPTASYVEILNSSSLQEQVTGTVVKVYKDKNTIVLKDDSGALQSYKVNDQVTYHSKQGSTLTIDDLAENDSLQLTLVGGNVTTVTKLNDQSQANGDVTIYDVDVKNSLLTVQAGSDIQSYILSDKVDVTYPDNRTDGVAGLRKGMSVDLKIANGTVNSIQVNTIVENGVVKAASADSSIVTYETSDGQLKAYKLQSNASVQIQGAAASLTDIQVGDQIVVEMNASGILSLNVTNRTMNSTTPTGNYIEGTLIGVDTSSKMTTLFMKDQNGQIQSYEFNTTYDLYIDGIPSTDLTQLKKDQMVKVQLYDGKISYVAVDNRIQGTVLRVDADNHLLSVALPGNEQMTYIVDNGCGVYIVDDSNASLNNILPNDVVQFTLSNNKTVTEIDVQRQINYKVTNVNTASNLLEVVDDRNNDRSLNLSGSVNFTYPGISLPKAEDVMPNDMVQATFLGNTLKSVEVKASARGIVTGVASDTKQVTIQQFGGSLRNISFQSNATVNRNGQVSNQVSSLSVGDRVEVSYQFDGSETIAVMQPVTATYNYYDQYNIYTLDGSQQYKYVYNVYVHEGANVIYLNSLSVSDKIKLYMLNGNVYEVEKVN